MSKKKKEQVIKKPADDIRGQLAGRIREPLDKLSQAMYIVMTDLFHEPEEMPFEPGMSIFESNGFVVLEVEIPGVESEDLYLRVEPRKAVIKGEVLASEDFDESEAFLDTRFYGPFETAIELPYSVDPDLTEAYYIDGILRVEMTADEDADDLPPKDITIH